MTNDKYQIKLSSPLKVRGARGVMKTMEVTPFSPPYFKGEI
jgi:hypothetical protein